MSERLRELISKGFHRANLERLCSECEGNIGMDPALYGPLYLLFRALLNDADPQAVPSQRINAYELALQRPLLELLDGSNQAPGVFRERLAELMRNAMAVLS